MANDAYDNAITDRAILRKIESMEAVKHAIRACRNHLVTTEANARKVLESIERDMACLDHALTLDDPDALADYLAEAFAGRGGSIRLEMVNDG